MLTLLILFALQLTTPPGTATTLQLFFVQSNGTGYVPPQSVPLPFACAYPGPVVGIQVNQLEDPTRALFNDPFNPTYHCEADISARVAGLPMGQYHLATSLLVGDTLKDWTGPDPHTSPYWMRGPGVIVVPTPLPPGGLPPTDQTTLNCFVTSAPTKYADGDAKLVVRCDTNGATLIPKGTKLTITVPQ